tara:strand:+ start:13320 stop:13700 length:381 start_codon:yes stop_codon:yes gene_type:complete
MKYLHESFNQFVNESLIKDYVKKFGDKMIGSPWETVEGWIEGIRGISTNDRDQIKDQIASKYYPNEKQTDPELMAKMEEEAINKNAECPRCGKSETGCVCNERDPYSTVNAYRAPSGDKKKKEDFK